MSMFCRPAGLLNSLGLQDIDRTIVQARNRGDPEINNSEVQSNVINYLILSQTLISYTMHRLKVHSLLTQPISCALQFVILDLVFIMNKLYGRA